MTHYLPSKRAALEARGAALAQLEPPELPIVYLNTTVGTYAEREGRVTATRAQADISRSGALLDKAGDYSVAVFRLESSWVKPLWIPQLAEDAAVDGISTVHSLTIRYTTGGGGPVFEQQISLDLIKTTPIPQVGQPSDDYAFVWTIDDACKMFNNAAGLAWAAIGLAGAPVGAENQPFFSTLPGELMKFTCFPYNLWHTRFPAVPALDKLEIFFSANCAGILSGWDFDGLVAGAPLSPVGADIRLLLWGDGSNYHTDVIAGLGQWPPRLEPTAPTAASLVVTQQQRSSYPAISRIILETSMPCIPEAQGAGGSGRSLVLTDFEIDASAVSGRALQIFNARHGDARWHDLIGDAPLSTFNLRISVVAYNGNVYTDELWWVGSEPQIKLCFTPKSRLSL